jgi:hypothetical protein
MSGIIQRLDLPAPLAAAAVDLTEFGVSEHAWSRSDALEFLNQLSGRRIVILGGDVLSSVRPLTYANANWHCDSLSTEDLDSYVARSHRVAREYIARYPDRNVWFVFVLQESPHLGPVT